MLRIALCDDDQNFLSGLHQEISYGPRGRDSVNGLL